MNLADLTRQGYNQRAKRRRAYKIHYKKRSRSWANQAFRRHRNERAGEH